MASRVRDEQWEDIDFDRNDESAKRLPKRRQHRFLWNEARNGQVSSQKVPNELLELCAYLRQGVDDQIDCAWWSCYFLKSHKGCPRQKLHVDNDELRTSRENPRIRFRDLSFSILVALEDDDAGTSLIGTDDHGNEITIQLKKGSACVFRGDWLHAGAANNERRLNRHLFIAVGSTKFPNNDYVGVVKDGPQVEVVNLVEDETELAM
jgi:hypothetical protein